MLVPLPHVSGAFPFHSTSAGRALRVLLCVVGCLGMSPASAARPGQSSVRAQLVWNDERSEWATIAIADGSSPRQVPLASVEDECLPVLLARDARAIVQDLDGDGSGDLALWSPMQPCWAFWKGWEKRPAVTPDVFSLTCSTPEGRARTKLCWGARSSPADAAPLLVAVVEDGQLAQVVTDSDFAPAGKLELVDLTFDGRADLMVPTSAGCAGNCWSNVWPFDAGSRRFVASRSLSHLANVRVVEPARKLLETRECGGQACAVFVARLLEVHGAEARVIAEAAQDDASPGSSTKRLKVTSQASDHAATVTCEALVDSEGRLTQRLAGACTGWPLTR